MQSKGRFCLGLTKIIELLKEEGRTDVLKTTSFCCFFCVQSNHFGVAVTFKPTHTGRNHGSIFSIGNLSVATFGWHVRHQIYPSIGANLGD